MVTSFRIAGSDLSAEDLNEFEKVIEADGKKLDFFTEIENRKAGLTGKSIYPGSYYREFLEEVNTLKVSELHRETTNEFALKLSTSDSITLINNSNKDEEDKIKIEKETRTELEIGDFWLDSEGILLLEPRPHVGPTQLADLLPGDIRQLRIDVNELYLDMESSSIIEEINRVDVEEIDESTRKASVTGDVSESSYIDFSERGNIKYIMARVNNRGQTFTIGVGEYKITVYSPMNYPIEELMAFISDFILPYTS